MHGYRDEVRARTAKSPSHTLLSLYQFSNSSIDEVTMMDKLNDAMVPVDDDGEDLPAPEYDTLGIKPSRSILLEFEHQDSYFPHFSQV